MNQPHPPPTHARTYAQLLRHYLRHQRRQVGLLAGLIIITIALQLINPQLVRRFLDAVEAERSLNELFVTAGIFMGVALLAKGTHLAGAYVGELVAWTATNALRADLAQHCLRLDMSFHKTHKPGELIERVDGDVNQLATFFSQLIIQMVSNLLLIAGVLVLLWLLDWRVGLTITLLGVAGLALLNWISRFTVPRWQRVREVSATLFGYVEEWLNSTEEIQTNAAAPYVMRRLYTQLRDRWLAMQAAMRMNFAVMALPNVVPALAYVAAYLWGDRLFRGGALTIGTVYIIFYYVDLIKDPLWVIQRQFEDLQRASASLNRILALFQERPSIHDGPITALPAGPLAVQFDHVTFAYDDAPPISQPQAANLAANGGRPSPHVLQDIAFALPAGRILGLLGRTGSGKSTLIRLLFRFYDPTAGAIRIGDGAGLHDLRQLDQAALRGRVGLVTQEVQLFRASLRDNLTLFDDGVPDARILAALADLGLQGWLAALPDGLDTRLEGGDNLSAGEAQLLALARVFLADPGLLILDEASSRLDPATEGLLERALDRLLAGRTVIIIAHRLATVQRADEIMILEDGRIREHAPRQQLLADP
ncbi:MAG: ABC transporter ATP-binding protein, partial [Anaerolineales bacterium]|nr:ABC transporter ATP-binding protein [Anaerolineales bacterium]